MSNVTRGLSASVLAAVRGKQAKTKMEDDREKETPPEDLEDDNNDPAAEAEETDPDAEDDGKKPDGEDEPDGDEGKAMSAAQARKAERSRIQAILTHPKAEANADLASHLAFNCSYSAKEAMAILNASTPSASAVASGGNRLADRMAGKTPKLGAGGTPSAQSNTQSLLASVGSAMKARHARNHNGD